MTKRIKKRGKVKSKPRVRKPDKARSLAAKKGWETRRGHTRKAMSKADFPPEIQRIIDERVRKEVARELKALESRKATPALQLARQQLVTEAYDQKIQQHIDAAIERGEFVEADETKILGRLFLVNELTPQDFDDAIVDLSNEYEDWSIHDIYELWYYGEVQ
jgi:hypothetical protein